MPPPRGGLEGVEGAYIPVFALCPFQGNPGASLLVEGEEAAVQLAAFVFQYAYEDFASGILQFLDAQAVDLSERVCAADDDTRYAAPDDEVGTWGRLAVMGTRLQVDVYGATAEKMLVLHALDGVHLGMRPATAAMIALADDASVADHHGSDHRIGRCSSLAATSQLQTSLHIEFGPLPILRRKLPNCSATNGQLPPLGESLMLHLGHYKKTLFFIL